jgi:hypothetical protein
MNNRVLGDGQNVLNPGYRQPETVQLAPDALVFINGSNMMQDPEGKVFDIRQDITDIETSLSTEQQGTAGFTISYPSTSGGREGQSKYKNLLIMSEVMIYFRGRFLKKSQSTQQKQFVGPQLQVVPPEGPIIYPYYQAFWGIITSITENYNDGVNTISVSCADILRWWQITNITVNPSLLSSVDSLKRFLTKNYGVSKTDFALLEKGLKSKDGAGRGVSLFSTIFSNKTIPEIFEACCNLSLLQMSPLNDYLVTGSVAVEIGQKIRAEIDKGQMNYWRERLQQVGRNLKIYGLKKDTRKGSETLGKWIIDPTQLITYPTLEKTKQLQDIGNINTFYQMFPAAPSIAKSDRKSQYEIANEVKEGIGFEFFMDVNGEIVLKMPFYNLNVSQNINSVIHDIDILSWSFVQSESEVVTRIDVTGAMANISDGGHGAPTGIAYSPLLTLQYGEREQQRHMPWLRNPKQCEFWGKVELARANALVRQGSISIIGRPELRLGYPVYIPSRDAFYYVKGIEHRFSFGGNFSTTLTVVAERSKGKSLTLFKNVGGLTDEQVTTPGTSIAESNTTNNFVTQLSMPSVCTPRAKEHVSVVKPNFAIDLSQISSMPFGDWQLSTGQEVDPTSATGQFQVTDADGYELMGQMGAEPYISYGYGLRFSANSTIDQPLSNALSSKAAIGAAQALKLKVENNSLVINPNNVAWTLDSEASQGAKMIDSGDTGPANNAAKAQKLSPDSVIPEGFTGSLGAAIP